VSLTDVRHFYTCAGHSGGLGDNRSGPPTPERVLVDHCRFVYQ
jgi:hypothetical protein